MTVVGPPSETIADIPINQHTAVSAIRAVVDRFVVSQAPAIAAAAGFVAEALAAGGVVQAFGTGHSQATAIELAGRAGGLVPTNRLALRDVVTLGGDQPATLDELAERDPAIAARVYDLAAVRPADVFVIASNSGGNGSVVEMALIVKARGHRLIAITSMDHSRRITSRHPSGQRLFEVADVVIDNCGPYGDALLELPGGGAACGVSSITSALAVQLMTAEVIARQLTVGVEPPVYVSANVPRATPTTTRSGALHGSDPSRRAVAGRSATRGRSPGRSVHDQRRPVGQSAHARR